MKYWSITVILISLTASVAMGQKQISTKKKQPTVSGFAHGFSDGTWLFLYDYTEIATSRPRLADSTKVTNEKFYLMDQQPSNIKTRYYSVQNKSGSEFKNFWISDQSIFISGIKGRFNKAITSGSVPQEINEEFERLRAPLSVEIDSLRRNFGNTDSLMAKKTFVLVDELKNYP